MKQRFSSLDIRASVHDLKAKLVGLRLQGIYDINSKTFLLKFAMPDRKEFLILESGIRLHLTQFSREKAVAPGSFCTKIRKHLKSRRLTAVNQAGVDRIVHFEFAAAAGRNEPGTYHLICEFYASGNVILTDHEFTVLSLLRVVNPQAQIQNKIQPKTKGKDKKELIEPKEENGFSLAVKDKYDLKAVSRDFEPATLDKVMKWIEVNLAKEQPKGGKNKKGDGLKKALNDVGFYGLALAEHALLEVGLDPDLDIRSYKWDEETNDKLIRALELADSTILNLDKNPSPGYILLDEKSGKSGDGAELYKEFHPLLFKQYSNSKYIKFDSFDMALDNFFSNIEGQRAEQKIMAQEEAAKNKIEAIKAEQMGRVTQLAEAEQKHRHLASVIEFHLELVDQIILVMRNLVASGMDWKEIGDMVTEEKRKGNPLAQYIISLQLETNRITVKLVDLSDDGTLGEEDEDEDDFDETDSEASSQSSVEPTYVNVQLDLNLTAYANSTSYYGLKKASAIKKNKTLAVANDALKNAEKKVLHDLASLKLNKPVASVSKMRKPMWFEKFNWFISSERYLVVAGRDLQQNEILVKKYLNKGDLYVHADMHGAATVVIKNPSGKPVPPSTLNQAGTMSVCHSKAWESKILTSAWWVFHHQVSKAAPTGEYLAAGSFAIRGKKNFLAPAALLYGFSLLYLLEPEFASVRANERKLKFAETENADQPVEVDDTASEITTDTASLLEQGVDKYGLLSSDLLQQPDFKPDEQPQEEGELSIVDKLIQSVQPTTERITAKNKANGKTTKLETTAEEAEIKTPNLVEAESNSTTAAPPAPKSKEGGVNPTQLKRGQKSKLKKIQSKYMDQDEEDRKLAMSLLGSDKGKQPKGKKGKLEQQRREEAEAKAQFKRLPPKQHQPKPVESKIEDNDDDDEDDLDLYNTDLTDCLVGDLRENELFTYMVPMAAPYSAIQNFKFKVKLQPGHLKKGKAAKQARQLFQVTTNSDLEKDALKIIPDQELIAAILGNCKLASTQLLNKKNKK